MPSRTLFAAAAFLLVTHAARADHRDFAPVAGDRLAISQSCARSVSVSVDPSLSGRVLLSADAAHAEEIDQLRADTENNAARVGLQPGRHACWRPDSAFEPSLRLRLRVPARFATAVSESGRASYEMGDTGALTLSLSGDVPVSASRVSGDVTADISGSGTVTLDGVDADRFTVRLSGSGVLNARSGRIGDLAIQESGAGRVAIAPTVENATLAASGSGTIALGGVRGSLTRASSGSGRISVGGRAVDAGATDTDEN